MSNTKISDMTVAELRAEISGHPRVVSGDKPMPGLSKIRKAELIEILTELQTDDSKALAAPEVDSHDFADFAKTVSHSLRNLPTYVQDIGTALHSMMETFTLAERQELNDAKFRGRFAGKFAVAPVGRRKLVAGTVVDRVLRGRDLLLVIRHATDAGHPRLSLHNAADVLI